jgi:membrane associated rhomboid family serine protease
MFDPADQDEILDDSAQFGTLAFYAAIGRAFLLMCAFVPVLYLIELVDYLNDQRFDRVGGIVPRRGEGLDGILFAPFLHASFAHLAANSVPLLLLGTFVLASGVRRFLYVTGFVMLISGLGVWLTADAGTATVGASGVIFGYLGFLLSRGVAERSWWSIAVAVLAGLLFGWQIIGVLPGANGHISWEAHLFGFIAGCVAAFLFRPGGLGLRELLANRRYENAAVYDDDIE